MYQFDNAAFTQNNRQFADVAAKAHRLALANAEKAFGLQLAAIEDNVNAAFAFWGELADVRDFDGLKAVWPKGAQVLRENTERSIGTAQEVLSHTIRTNESIAQLAKGQFEKSAAVAKSEVEKVAQAAAAEVEKASKVASKAAR